MKKQVFNPYLPSYEYVPDGEPHIFGDRLYVFGSHDRFKGKKFCMNDYVAWSAPTCDLTDWRYEGVIYQKIQDPDNADGTKVMYAPDVAQGPDGRFYLYYGLADDDKIGVAVCDTPAGKYEFLDCVHDAKGEIWGRRPQDFMPFDPGILVDEDGRIHLYAGQGPMMEKKAQKEYETHFHDSAYYVELEADMVTMKTEPKRLLPNRMDSAGSGFEEHEFFEANSIRRFDGKYYFIYSSVQSHELCWAVSDRPDGGFVYGGVLTSNGDAGPAGLGSQPAHRVKLKGKAHNYIGNNHGSVVEIDGKYYVFGHRQTSRSFCNRQGYAEKIEFADGAFSYAELTSCGLNDGPLRGIGVYEARIACHLESADGPVFSAFGLQGRKHPAFMQEGEDREEDPNQYIQNMRNGASALYRYFDFTSDKPTRIGVQARGKGSGMMMIYNNEQEEILLAAIPIEIKDKKVWKNCISDFICPDGESALYFKYLGKGSVDILKFAMK